ncbi:MAG TPA: efflux RND transporter periplasmic adaptor subunit [Burkholderiales bacterium]|nr:efflux RND transporter periplasmic adaptor subunit [Burkholderiales bacterium]
MKPAPASTTGGPAPGDRAQPPRRQSRLFLLAGLAVVALGAGAYGYWWLQQPRLPAGFASSNGRIEATEYDIATKRAGRVVAVRVHEGDLVEKGQVLAEIDTDELAAQRRQAEAELQHARDAERTAAAVVAQREGERKLAVLDRARSEHLAPSGAVSAQELDQDRTRVETSQAAVHAAQEQVKESKSASAAAEANLKRIQTQIDESTLVSPARGRVLYRLAEPGEVLAAGGKVVTVLDLADVYMTIFLPTEQAGRVAYGAEARMVVDAYPDLVLPATVSFASPEAQFTPKEVETHTEREKLMFRFKVKLDEKLLEQHLEQVKTGVPGVSYIRLAGGGEWPAYLAVKLPPP